MSSILTLVINLEHLKEFVWVVDHCVLKDIHMSLSTIKNKGVNSIFSICYRVSILYHFIVLSTKHAFSCKHKEKELIPVIIIQNG